jgi:hypothetical protein
MISLLRGVLKRIDCDRASRRKIIYFLSFLGLLILFVFFNILDTPINWGIGSGEKNRYVVDCITRQPLWRISESISTVPLGHGTTLKMGSRGQSNNERLAQFQALSSITNHDGVPNPGHLTNAIMSSQNALTTLHFVVETLKSKLKRKRIKMLDIQSGHSGLLWIQHFLTARQDVDYTAMDNVPEALSNHRVLFSHRKWRFLAGDIVKNGLNETYDLVFTRYMMQHLTLEDAMNMLHHIQESKSKYLLMSTWPSTRKNEPNFVMNLQNSQIERNLNMMTPPFQLVPPSCFVQDAEHSFLGLWPLPLEQVRDCSEEHLQRKFIKEEGGTQQESFVHC